MQKTLFDLDCPLPVQDKHLLAEQIALLHGEFVLTGCSLGKDVLPRRERDPFEHREHGAHIGAIPKPTHGRGNLFATDVSIRLKAQIERN
ncbi:hypothetical protein D3C85_1561220 [compost metagenome]